MNLQRPSAPAMMLTGRRLFSSARAALVSRAVAKPTARPAAHAVVSTLRSELKPYYDIVVIGGGVIGCSVAYHAARAGATVVVERRGIAAEQSSKSWGFCRQQGRDTRELRLMRESIARWEQLEDELDADMGWQQGGNLMLFAGEKEKQAQTRWASAAQPCGVKSEVLDQAGVAAVFPGMSSDRITGGLWTRSDGTTDPERSTLAFAAAASRAGNNG